MQAAGNMNPGLSNRHTERATAIANVLKRKNMYCAKRTSNGLPFIIKSKNCCVFTLMGLPIKMLNRNFQGTNVLVAAQFKGILPLAGQPGINRLYTLNDEGHNILFAVTLYDIDKNDVAVKVLWQKPTCRLTAINAVPQ